jgi:hypothetical protein
MASDSSFVQVRISACEGRSTLLSYRTIPRNQEDSTSSWVECPGSVLERSALLRELGAAAVSSSGTRHSGTPTLMPLPMHYSALAAWCSFDYTQAEGLSVSALCDLLQARSPNTRIRSGMAARNICSRVAWFGLCPTTCRLTESCQFQPALHKLLECCQFKLSASLLCIRSKCHAIQVVCWPAADA